MTLKTVYVEANIISTTKTIRLREDKLNCKDNNTKTSAATASVDLASRQPEFKSSKKRYRKTETTTKTTEQHQLLLNRSYNNNNKSYNCNNSNQIQEAGISYSEKQFDESSY